MSETRVKTPDGLNGEVQNVSVLKQKVRVIVTLDNDEKEVREYMAASLNSAKNVNAIMENMKMTKS